MKLHHLLTTVLLASASTLAFAHPGGHGDEAPSADECVQLKKLSKADAEKPAMKELKAQCEAAQAKEAGQDGEHKHSH